MGQRLTSASVMLTARGWLHRRIPLPSSDSRARQCTDRRRAQRAQAAKLSLTFAGRHSCWLRCPSHPSVLLVMAPTDEPCPTSLPPRYSPLSPRGGASHRQCKAWASPALTACDTPASCTLPGVRLAPEGPPCCRRAPTCPAGPRSSRLRRISRLAPRRGVRCPVSSVVFHGRPRLRQRRQGLCRGAPAVAACSGPCLATARSGSGGEVLLTVCLSHRHHTEHCHNEHSAPHSSPRHPASL